MERLTDTIMEIWHRQWQPLFFSYCLISPNVFGEWIKDRGCKHGMCYSTFPPLIRDILYESKYSLMAEFALQQQISLLHYLNERFKKTLIFRSSIIFEWNEKFLQSIWWNSMFANKTPEVTGFHGYCTFFKNGTCQIHANCISSLEITHVSSFIGSLSTQMFSRCHKDCLISFSDGSLCPVLKAHIKRSHLLLVIFTSHHQVSHACKSPCVHWEQSHNICSAPWVPTEMSQIPCISVCSPRADSSATPCFPVMLGMTIFLFQEWNESSVISCYPNGLGASDENEDRTRNLGQWSGDRQPLLDWGAESTLSPAFTPSCRLQDFLWSHLCQDTTLTRPRSPCFYPGLFPLGSSREQPASAKAVSMPDAHPVFRDPRFHDPSHTPFWVWPWGL